MAELTFPRGTILRLIERHGGKEADAERNTPHRRQMKVIHQKVKTIKQVMLPAGLTLHKTGLELPAPVAWLEPSRCLIQTWRVKKFFVFLKNEWIRKMWYIYIMEYYSAIKSTK